MWALLRRRPFWCGLVLRLFLGWLLPYLMDDGNIIPGVAYTDVDYHVFTDAAQHTLDGNSPYDRHTYRYTPFLAWILSYLLPLSNQAGRMLFCLADALCGAIILHLRKRDQPPNNDDKDNDDKNGVWWWMYNPLAINICTRGSAESFMVLLPVLATVAIVMSSWSSNSWIKAVSAGLVHGIAIHSKLYPIIYTLSFMVYFGVATDSPPPRIPPPPTRLEQPPSRRLLDNVHWWGLWVYDFGTFWIQRLLLQPAPMLFLVSSVTSFVSLTCLAVHWFGNQALHEGLLYHFSRADHRHNYSVYWYGIYLSKARFFLQQQDSPTQDYYWLLGQGAGKWILLLPQAVLLLYTSLVLAPRHLGLTLFVQTYLFVTLNKVITAQYFVWYLCLLPLCSHQLVWTSSMVQWALGGLALSIVTWLGSAYLLEMQGLPVFGMVWWASILYFVANIHLLCAILHSYQQKQQQQRAKSE